MCRMPWLPSVECRTSRTDGSAWERGAARESEADRTGIRRGPAGGLGRPRAHAIAAASPMGLLGLVGLVLAVASPVAEAGVKLESASPPMLDGTPTLLAGEPFEPCVVLEGGVAMKLIKIEDFGAEQSNGPAFARVTYAQGRDQVVEDVAYWRLAIPRADSIAALADVSVVETVDGGLTVTASLAHRTDRAIGAVDHGTLSLVVMDRSSGASVRLSTWGEWIEGEGGLMEYATLSSAVNCVSLSDFTGDVPPNSPIVGALTGSERGGEGGGEGGGGDLIWILQGQGLEGDFSFSTWGGLVASPTALNDVKAFADEAGWTIEPIEKPEPSACSFGGWTIPPVQPCIWTVQPAPDNPPPNSFSDAGFEDHYLWTGRWSQSAAASIAGARLSRSQYQGAYPPGLWTSKWNPVDPFAGNWSGRLIVNRTGACGSCPCEIQVLASPESVVKGMLDAIAYVKGSLLASVTLNRFTSKTQLAVEEYFGADTQIEAGSNGVEATVTEGAHGQVPIVGQEGASPGPLNQIAPCGETIQIQSGVSIAGWTQLWYFGDFPGSPNAELLLLGRTKWNFKFLPVTGPGTTCGDLPPQVEQWSDPDYPL